MKDTPEKKRFDTKYESSPEQVKKREERNQARAAAKKAGVNLAGKDVDHKKPLGSGGTNAPGNTRAISVKQNRGWRRGESGYTPKKV
jgi:hypothetical protein